MNAYVKSAIQINILLVENKPENLPILKRSLHAIDCNIVVARSSQEALNYMRNYEFALLLLDSKILQLASLVTTDIPIILIGNNSVEESDLFKEDEVSTFDLLPKPISPSLLRSKIRVFLDLYQQKKLLKKQAELIESNVKELRKLREVNCQLECLSTLDGMTGIPNRRHFDQSIKKYWKNAIREQQPLALLMIDIDNFKSYNDTYGHLQGDDCLILVAKTLVSCLNRPNDFVARYGGEEFVAVLPNSDKKGSYHVAEKMRKCIEKLAIEHPKSCVSDYVTISIGVAEITPQASDSIVEFITNADNALYQAKLHGRNKVYQGNSPRSQPDKVPVQRNIMARSFREAIAGLWLS